MPGLQEWIHALEEGKGAVYIKRLFVLLAFAGLAAAYDVRNYKNFANPEAMDSAQVARQLARGQGFTTKFIRPFSVKLIQMKHGESMNKTIIDKHPDLANPPVFPVIEAGLMKALPFDYDIPDGSNFSRYQPEMILTIFNQLLFGFLLWSIFVLARRLFDPAVAWTTLIVLGLTELFWRFTLTGLPTILLTLITVWIVWCLTLIEQRVREQTASATWIFSMSAVVGVLLAIGTLTKYSYGWMALPILLYAGFLFGPARGGSIAAIAVILVLAVAPWCYRNFEICGKPFGIAGYAAVEGTTYFPNNRLQRSMPQNLAFELNKISMAQYTKKMLVGIGEVIRNEAPKLGGSWVSAFFLVGLLAPFRNPGLSRLRYFLLGSLVVAMVVQAVGRTELSNAAPQLNSEYMLIYFAPLVFMFGLALFFTLIDQIPFEFPHYRVAAITGFLGVVSLPLILSFLPPRTIPFNFPPYYPPAVRNIAGWLKEEEIMMSDMPWAAAWYGDRICVWTTLDTGLTTPSDFFAISDYLKPVQLLYLTPITLDVKFASEMLKGKEAAWSRFALDGLMRTNVPAGFPLKHSPRGYLPDFLILTDRRRWSK